MKWHHLNRRFAVQTVTLLVLFTLVGCRGSQTAMTNPFLAPDRVPPPATRMVAPGTAQPYYPGDPLPAVQSGTTSAAPPVAASQSAPPTSRPASELAVASAPNVAVASPALVASREPSVSIPSDDNRLRFELPLPPAESTPQVPTGTPAVVAAQNPTASFASSVVPAVYDETNAYQVTNADRADLADSGPWRAPRVPRSNVAPASVPNSQPTIVQPTLAVAPQYNLAPAPQPLLVAPVGRAALATMPVQLRAVPSPSSDNASSVPPRIRFAGPPTPLVTPPGGWVNTPVGQAAYIGPTPGSVVQSVQVTELPMFGGYRAGAAPSVASAPPDGTATSPDGFRPRGSAR